MRVDGSVARETARLHVTVLGLIVFGHDVGEFDGRITPRYKTIRARSTIRGNIGARSTRLTKQPTSGVDQLPSNNRVIPNDRGELAAQTTLQTLASRQVGGGR